MVGALAVVNAAGEVVAPDTGEPYAAEYEHGGEFGVTVGSSAGGVPLRGTGTADERLNTTIGVVAVDAASSKGSVERLAVAARTARRGPCGLPHDVRR